MNGLRKELEEMVAKADQRIEERREAGRVQVAQRVDISLIRGLLAAYPAKPAPVASPKRVAEVLQAAASEWDEPIGDGDVAQLVAALLAAGVFRDEAKVKAELAELIAVRSQELIGEGPGVVAAAIAREAATS